MKIKSFVIPEHVVPEQIIRRCFDCPWFENRGGSYGEYHKCRHLDGPDDDLHFSGGEDIADGCPMVKEELT